MINPYPLKLELFFNISIAVSKLAKQYEIPVIAFSGALNKGYESIYNEGIDAAFSIIPELSTLEEALDQGYVNLRSTAANVAQLLKFHQ